jgi:hypothetical protein
MNWKEFGSKRSLSNFWNKEGISLEGLSKTTKKLRITGLLAEI